MELSCRLYKLLTGLYWNLPAGRNLSREHRYRKIEPALQYIETNYSKSITLEDLAREAGVSPRHLCVLFREALHTRPFWYVNAFRINMIKRMLLEDRDRPISEIAQDCGYDNICYFNQTFREITGMSPSQFRKLH